MNGEIVALSFATPPTKQSLERQDGDQRVHLALAARIQPDGFAAEKDQRTEVSGVAAAGAHGVDDRL